LKRNSFKTVAPKI